MQPQHINNPAAALPAKQHFATHAADHNKNDIINVNATYMLLPQLQYHHHGIYHVKIQQQLYQQRYRQHFGAQLQT
ncbi:unnamed protein product [Ceratitis capitata]|uniref:(Mediterranean fruit fly) hypothetical protein n=1 Tax=Ceratitis capitata TaxID=7213 RepID=A0A811VIF3_CERCA|nr:unnamed protein product [Ceratitis capitata]